MNFDPPPDDGIRTARYLAEAIEPPWCFWSDESLELVNRVFWPSDSRNSRLSIRWLDGKRMQTPDQMLDEMDAALQFPWYFGRNWNAVIDCLRDTDWEARGSYILLVRNSELVGCQAPDDELQHLVGVFSTVGQQLTEEFEESYDQLRRPTPFHVLFHVESAASEQWQVRLAAEAIEIPKLPIRNVASWE